MNNFITYEYEEIIPSNLSSKTIIMIGRANDKMKRFDLGILSMKYIIKEIPDCEIKIIYNLHGTKYLKDLIDKLNLKKNVKFEGFTLNPEMYYINASLHIFPTVVECFPMVLSETKIYGIPSIISGINYVSISTGGVINIDDDNPKKIAKESIKIIKNNEYRKNLGKIARESMKKFKNELTLRKWIELILAVYKGEYYYNKLKEENKKISEKEAINHLENQIKLIKKRKPEMHDLSLKDILNFKFIDKYIKYNKI